MNTKYTQGLIHNTLVFKLSDYMGSQWVIYIATVVYTHSVALDDQRVGQSVVKFI